MEKFNFAMHLIEMDLDPDQNYAQTALVDLDNDGLLEYVVGQQYGEIYWYKFHPKVGDVSGYWSRHLLGLDSPSDVGGCAFDVDGDGWIDFVAGGAWYRNSRSVDLPFEKYVFDPELSAAHDVTAADIDGDGQLEVITMSDRNSLRWYKIPANPTQHWALNLVGEAVHAGVSIGDIDGDGDLDIVRTDVWFENVKGDATQWEMHPIGPNTPPPPDFQPYFAFNATYSVVCDMNKDGKNDIVFTDAEIPGGKIWWMENLDGKGKNWKRHEIYNPATDEPRRGAFHSLFVGDLDDDHDLDVFSCEMEAVPGNLAPRYYIWENLDGLGGSWKEHTILNANLGGHAAVLGSVSGNGKLDILAKPWRSSQKNALGGKMFVVYLENQSR